MTTDSWTVLDAGRRVHAGRKPLPDVINSQCELAAIVVVRGTLSHTVALLGGRGVETTAQLMDMGPLLDPVQPNPLTH